MADSEATPSTPAAFHLKEIWEGSVATASLSSLLMTIGRLRKMFADAMARTDRGNMLLDMTACTSIDSGGLLLLMYAGRWLKARGWPLWLTVPDKRGSTVTRVVVENLNHYFLPKDMRKGARPLGAAGDYLMRGISQKNDMVEELEEWSRTLHDVTSATDEELARWGMQISEVTTNAFQHAHQGDPSKDVEVIIVGKRRSKSRYVQLAALDDGLGIPHVVRPTAFAAGLDLDDGDLIEYACRDGVTSRCVAENQGRGLATLIYTLKQSRGGRLVIYSGNGVYHFNGEKAEVWTNVSGDGVSLTGTLTVVTLRL